MKFKISGSRKDTGDNVQMTIEAADQRSAQTWAEDHGIEWSFVVPQKPATPQPAAPAVPVAEKKETVIEEGDESAIEDWAVKSRTDSAASPPPAPAAPRQTYVPAPGPTGYFAQRDVVIWAVGALAVAAWFFTQNKSAAFADSEAIEQSLGSAAALLLFVIVCGVVAAKTLGRRSNPARLASVAAAVAIFVLHAANQNHVRQAKAQVSAIPQVSQPVAVTSNTPAASPQPVTTPKAPVINEKVSTQADDAKLLLDAVGLMAVEQKNFDTDYQQRFQNISGDGIVRLAKIATPEKIASTRANLLALQDLMTDREKRYAALSQDVPDRINKLSISQEMKDAAIRGFQLKAGMLSIYNSDLTTLDTQYIAQCRSLVDFMESRLGKFRVDGSTVYFQEGADTNQFNSIEGRIDDVDAQEQKAAAQIRDFNQKSIDEFQQVFKSAQ